MKLATRARAALAAFRKGALAAVDGRGSGWIVIREAFGGAWQSDVEITPESALTNSTVYACVTQIAADIGKLRLRLTELKEGVWQEVPAFSPIFRRPNRYQTRQKFIESWILSKVIWGNTYVLKVRDEQGRIVGAHVLDPNLVQPLVSAGGTVFYQLASDNLAGIPGPLPAVPASEIIHDTTECLFHPLVGVPPLYAAGLAAMQGNSIQSSSSKFFANGARPSGVLTAPGEISDETAERLKEYWEEKYTGENAGKVAVLGDGLKYEALTAKAVDAQLVEQWKWTDEKICSAFKVPPYKVYVGPMPTYQNAEVLDRIYYAGCLQRYIESIEALLDDGLGLPPNFATEFDLDDLMRMDTALKMKTMADGVAAGILAPNEGRRKFNLPPVPGGNTPYLQQQNYSLAALDRRDGSADPFGGGTPPAAAADTIELMMHISKGLECETT